MASSEWIDPEDLVSALESPHSVSQAVRSARLTLRSTPEIRKEYGRARGFWEALARVWSEQAKKLEQDDRDVVPIVQALAAFLIGLTSADAYNQLQALAHIEPHLRSILSTSSSLFHLEDSLYQPMTRTCCQALANLVTSNPTACSTYFPERLQAEESDLLLQRLLATPDEATLQAVLIFLLNAIHSDPGRALLLGTSRAGSAILDRIMILVSATYDNDSQANPAPTSLEGSDLFGLSFSIMKQIIEQGAFPQTYSEHKLLPGFLVSPTLIVFLKYLDGYLSSHLSSPEPLALSTSLSVIPFLQAQLALLAAHLLDKGERERSDALGFQGVVLILHALCEIGLGFERHFQRESEEEAERSNETVKAEGNAKLSGSVELVVRLLHYSSSSIPGVSARPTPDSSRRISEIDPENPASIPRPATAPIHDDTICGQVDHPESTAPGSAGFQQLKLICVKFLGIVTFQPFNSASGRRFRRDRMAVVEAIQDEIRESGGLGLLLGMCQIDGRNPTLREHALLAIRNILKNNLRNQEYIDNMKPQYKVGEDGSLLDLPPPLRPPE
ncbi:hypothetical protein JCM16303_002502 [Sporobolomyces ruberrimus]